MQERAETASELVAKDCNKIVPSRHDRAMHFRTHSSCSCFPKSCTRSEQLIFSMDIGGGTHQTPPLAENDWQLKVTGEGKVRSLQRQGFNQVTHAPPVHGQAAIAELSRL